MKPIALLTACLFGMARSMRLMPPAGIDAINAAGDREGGITRIAEVDINCHLLVTWGTAPATQMKLCTAATRPIGCCYDSVTAGNRMGIERLLDGGTKVVIASKAIAAGVRVYATAGGKVTDAVVSGAYLVGESLEAAAADGEEMEILPLSPVANP